MQNHTLPGVNALERAVFSMEAAAPYCEAHGSPIIAEWLRSSAAELIATIDARRLQKLAPCAPNHLGAPTMNLATCYNYKAHTVYTDGRLYQDHTLIGIYKTEAAAKGQATRRSKAQHKTRAAEHHASILAIWERKQ